MPNKLSEEEVESVANKVADKVVEKAKESLLAEFGRVVWAAAQKAFIALVGAVWAWGQWRGH